MRGAAIKTDGAICAAKPDDNAARFHLVAPLRKHDGPRRLGCPSKFGERLSKNGMERDYPAMALLCSAIPQLQDRANSAVGSENHLPREIRNFSGSQASFYGEQDDHAVSKRVTSRFGKE